MVGLDLIAVDRTDAVRQLVALLVSAGRADDAEALQVDVMAREAQMATGMAGRVGLPHARSEHVLAPSVAIGRFPGGVDFDAPDGLADLVFLVGVPASDGALFLRVLAAVARLLVDDEFRDAVRRSASAAEVSDMVTSKVRV